MIPFMILGRDLSKGPCPVLPGPRSSPLFPQSLPKCCLRLRKIKSFLNKGAFSTQYAECAPWRKLPQGGLTQATVCLQSPWSFPYIRLPCLWVGYIMRGLGNRLVWDPLGCVHQYTSSSGRRRGPGDFGESWFK